MSLRHKIALQVKGLRYLGRWTGKTGGYAWRTIPLDRIAIVNDAVTLSGPDCRYLEIGCRGDNSFTAVTAARKVGVDPVQGGTVRATSDEFFRTNAEQFDVVFVDGLHTYEQARRDAVNGLACLPVGGFIVFHDMLPNSWREEAPAVIDRAWTGDVWKLAVDLAATRGIVFHTVIADHGVGILQKRDRDVTVANEAPTPDRRMFADFLKLRERMNLIDHTGYRRFIEGVAQRRA